MGESVAVDEIVAVASTVRDEGGALVRPDLVGTYTVSFGADVSVSADHLVVRNDTLGGAVVNTSGVVMNYDSNSQIATWDFSSLSLDAGYYTFELSDAITTANGGSALDGDNDGTVGGNYSESIYVAIPGDANLDGNVEVNDINIFSGTNTGDGATVLSNLNRAGTYNWSQGDFNGDGDVDSSQLNIFSGVQSGDYAVFLANLGRSVVPSGSQAVTSQPVASQPVVSQSLVQDAISQPVLAQSVVSQPVTVALSALPVSATVQTSSSVVVPIAVSAVVAPVDQNSFASEVLLSSVTSNASELSGVQANVDVLNEDVSQLVSSAVENVPLVVALNSSLDLEGAHELLDGIFSADIGDDQYDVAGDLDEAAEGDFAEAWDWLSFA